MAADSPAGDQAHVTSFQSAPYPSTASLDAWVFPDHRLPGGPATDLLGLPNSAR